MRGRIADCGGTTTIDSRPGQGTEVELRVERNESPSQDDDFLRPKEGSILKLFTVDLTHEMRVGETVRAVARLNAGPTGSRAVLQRIEPLKR